ncbi:uncharacterized protein LOC100370273 [Saccoglossus kowalevskii]|uniref:Uncharacterized protein LOC100370273 n=1 Tax=Saccoglossus kowalevskii TaxID=10224 RepID=A0ABM0GW65_SACKO|nr:PREDICTED: uncharacterized protein LOC100370273 [Saccoglossus kowalevskii]
MASSSATSSSRSRGQGHSTSTILTNRAKDITVISDVAFKDRKTPISPDRPPKGTRQMHRTTLTFDKQPPKMDYLTSSFSAFGGSKSVSPAVRPLPCPSLHSSHFDIGITRQKFYNTHYGGNYLSKETTHPNETHYPSLVNRSFNMRGADMQDVLVRRNWQPNYWSSYTDVHDRLGMQRGPGEARPTPAHIRHNIINGRRIGPEIPQDHHRISGNRVLYNGYRRDNHDYFVLG